METAHTPSEQWWIQTLVSPERMCSPRVMGLHSVTADSEGAAVDKLAEQLDATHMPAATLPKIVREGREAGQLDSQIIEAMQVAVTTALSAEPKGLVITAIGTDFGAVTGLRAQMGELSEQNGEQG